MKPEIQLSDWLEGRSQNIVLPEKSVTKLASLIANAVMPSDWILLEGDLGAGKTTFVSALLAQFSDSKFFTSPTFSILNVHELSSTSTQLTRACHLDLYRLRSDEELIHLGLELQINDTCLTLIEWAENIQPEGWGSFFEVTHCRRPRRIMKVGIEHLERTDERRYALGWLDFEAFVGRKE